MEYLIYEKIKHQISKKKYSANFIMFKNEFNIFEKKLNLKDNNTINKYFLLNIWPFKNY